MTDAELIEKARECILGDSLTDKNQYIELLVNRLIQCLSERNYAKSSMRNLVFAADEDDQEHLAWAIQLVRDDLGYLNEQK